MTGQSSEFIVTTSGDTLFGRIDHVQSKAINTALYFKTKGATFRQLYTPNDLGSFQSKKLGTFVSSETVPAAGRIFTNKPYFLQPLLAGDLQLYTLRVGKIEKLAGGDRYNYSTVYLVVEDGVGRLFNGQGELKDFQESRGCPVPANGKGYDAVSVANYFAALAECQGGRADVLTESAKLEAVDRRWHVYADIAYNSYNWQPTVGSLRDKRTFLANNRFDYSVRVGRVIANRVELMVGLSYARYESEATGALRVPTTINDTSVTVLRVNQSVLAPSLTARYNVPIGQSGISAFLGLGFRYGLSLERTNEEVSFVRDQDGTYSLEYQPVDNFFFEQANFIQVIPRAGFSFNLGEFDPYVEARYHFGQSILKDQNYIYTEGGVALGVRF